MGSDRKKIHVINNLPHIYELEDMIYFCRSCQEVYIWGNGEVEQYLLKYLDMSGIDTVGFVVGREEEVLCDFSSVYRKLPLFLFDEIQWTEEKGIIIGTSERWYHRIIPFLRSRNFNHYFAITEYNRLGIVGQVMPRERDEFTVEISLADHCNLSCQMCDHFSQLSCEWYPEYNQLCRDIRRLGQLFEHEIAAISFLGGEPTLNENLLEYLKLARIEFPNAEIIILTNGIKLLDWEYNERGNLWEICKEYDVHIMITVYPIKIPYERIEQKGIEYGVQVEMSSNIHADELTKQIKISDKHTLDLMGNIEPFYSVNCLYFNKFTVLKEGKIYMCPMAAHINIFNERFAQNLEVSSDDYVDIYKAISWQEVVEFSSKYNSFCRYCDLKKWHHHSAWKPSNKTLEEYI